MCSYSGNRGDSAECAVDHQTGHHARKPPQTSPIQPTNAPNPTQSVRWTPTSKTSPRMPINRVHPPTPTQTSNPTSPGSPPGRLVLLDTANHGAWSHDRGLPLAATILFRSLSFSLFSLLPFLSLLFSLSPFSASTLHPPSTNHHHHHFIHPFLSFYSTPPRLSFFP